MTAHRNTVRTPYAHSPYVKVGEGDAADPRRAWLFEQHCKAAAEGRPLFDERRRDAGGQKTTNLP